MKINFQSVSKIIDKELLEHAQWLADYKPVYLGSFKGANRPPPDGFESFVCVDAMGEQFLWLNEQFPREQYIWYLWFESVFLVTPQMATLFRLKWA
jgi:hypothetical protein